MSFTQVTVTGTIKQAPDTPIVGGQVIFLLSDTITDDESFLEPTPQVAVTASDGTFSIVVPADDDVSVGVYYLITITDSVGLTREKFKVNISAADAPTVSLISLAQL